MTGTIFTEGYIPANSLADLFIHSDSDAKRTDQDMGDESKPEEGYWYMHTNQYHRNLLAGSLDKQCLFRLLFHNSALLLLAAHREKTGEQLFLQFMGEEEPWKQMTLKTHECLKSTPNIPKASAVSWPLGSLQHGLETCISNPNSSPPFQLQLQTKFLQGLKKVFAWTPCSNFSNSPLCVLGQRRGKEQWGGQQSPASVTEQLLQASPPTWSWPLPAPLEAGSHPLKANIVLPKGTGLTALDIQLAHMWSRWWAWGRQWGWSCFPHGDGALPMYLIPAQEEITHPAATRCLAQALKSGRRLQLLTRHPGCCFQKTPDTTGSHMPECQVTLWKWSWKWDLRLPRVFIPCFIFFLKKKKNKKTGLDFENFLHCHYSILIKKLN